MRDDLPVCRVGRLPINAMDPSDLQDGAATAPVDDNAVRSPCCRKMPSFGGPAMLVPYGPDSGVAAFRRNGFAQMVFYVPRLLGLSQLKGDPAFQCPRCIRRRRAPPPSPSKHHAIDPLLKPPAAHSLGPHFAACGAPHPRRAAIGRFRIWAPAGPLR